MFVLASVVEGPAQVETFNVANSVALSALSAEVPFPIERPS
jgi:hypothetical protein